MKYSLLFQKFVYLRVTKAGAQRGKGRKNQMNIEVKVTKLEWLKDENGNYIYDQKAIEKFRAKAIKAMQRQNAKIAASPKLQRSYSICDPVAFANSQVEMYMHNFRMYNEIDITKR